MTFYIGLTIGSHFDNVPPVELSVSGYDRVPSAQIDKNWSEPDITGKITNKKVITFSSPTTDDFGVVTGFGIWNQAIGGKLLCHGSFDTAVSIPIGALVSFPIGYLTIGGDN